MKNLNKTDIGLIGLAVMGENLALNMADKGWQVSVYNRTVPGVEEGVVERFMNGRARGKRIQGYTDMALFVESIATPRKIMMMVRAGSAVDELMEQLFPLLSPGDILIDGETPITRIPTAAWRWLKRKASALLEQAFPVVRKAP